MEKNLGGTGAHFGVVTTLSQREFVCGLGWSYDIGLYPHRRCGWEGVRNSTQLHHLDRTKKCKFSYDWSCLFTRLTTRKTHTVVGFTIHVGGSYFDFFLVSCIELVFVAPRQWPKHTRNHWSHGHANPPAMVDTPYTLGVGKPQLWKLGKIGTEDHGVHHSVVKSDLSDIRIMAKPDSKTYLSRSTIGWSGWDSSSWEWRDSAYESHQHSEAIATMEISSEAWWWKGSKVPTEVWLSAAWWNLIFFWVA